ncbi:MAG: hypothetical protein IJD85_07005 [Oscillospiraceae bacterium]|nr:hypothetical protein [Oscillospiraceae bacterium]
MINQGKQYTTSNAFGVAMKALTIVFSSYGYAYRGGSNQLDKTCMPVIYFS